MWPCTSPSCSAFAGGGSGSRATARGHSGRPCAAVGTHLHRCGRRAPVHRAAGRLAADRRDAAGVPTTDPQEARRLAEEIDRYCFEQSKALFLCAPQALYAVNRHVDFKAYRATFELADTAVDPAHWSRRNEEEPAAQ